MSKEALIMVDVQNDFCPGGKLGVKDGDQVVGPLNALKGLIEQRGGLVIATRDWHPEKTTHFNTHGGIWPEHCVQGTEGAQFHPDLDTRGALVVSKGMGETEDAYSGFEARDDQGRLLEDILKAHGVRRVYVGGLATDYCVKATVLDAVKKGFITVVPEWMSKAVDLQPGDGNKAIEEMVRAGADVMRRDEQTEFSYR